jgi:hypothetical protein
MTTPISPSRPPSSTATSAPATSSSSAARGESAGSSISARRDSATPACDLAALLTYGEPFAQKVLAAYPALRPALPRARFYRGTFAAQEALYGVEHGDPAAFARGIAPYLTDEATETDA